MHILLSIEFLVSIESPNTSLKKTEVSATVVELDNIIDLGKHPKEVSVWHVIYYRLVSNLRRMHR